VHDGTSYAYGHPTIEFIDSTSGQHLYFTVLAYGIDNGGDYLGLIRRVKEKFDPRGGMNPGRFLGGN